MDGNTDNRIQKKKKKKRNAVTQHEMSLSISFLFNNTWIERFNRVSIAIQGGSTFN